MNNKAFQEWIKSTQDQKASQNLHNTIDTFNRRTPFKQALKFAVLTLTVLLSGFMLLVNISQSFYIFALDTPLKEFASALRLIGDGYDRSINEEKYQTIDQKVSIDGRDIVIESMVIDANFVIFKTQQDETFSLLTASITVTDSHGTPATYIHGTYHNKENITVFSFDRDIQNQDTITLIDDDREVLSVRVDGSRIHETTQIAINETVSFKEGTVTIDDLSFGGIKSTLTVTTTAFEGFELNSMNLNIITNTGAVIQSTSQASADESTRKHTVEFDVGSLIDKGVQALELSYITWISSDHQTLTYNIADDSFNYLPDSIQYLGISNEADTATFKFIEANPNPLLPTNILYPVDFSEVGYSRFEDDTLYVINVNLEEYLSLFKTQDTLEFHNSIPDVEYTQPLRFSIKSQ